MKIFIRHAMVKQKTLEGARDSAYLHQVNFCRRPLSKHFEGPCPDRS